MEHESILFTSVHPIQVGLYVEPLGPDPDDAILNFSTGGRPLCHRLQRSERDRASATRSVAKPVYLHVAVTQNEDQSVSLAILAQIRQSPSDQPHLSGVAGLADSPARFYPLGDLLMNAHDRLCPDDLLEEARLILDDRIGHPFTCDIDRALDALLNSLSLERS